MMSVSLGNQEPFNDSRSENCLRAQALIDQAALRHNAAQARRLSGHARLCAVVKADAYGHGMPIVVPTLLPLVDCFAVATLEEGVNVRNWTRDHDVIVLSEFNHPAQVQVFNRYRLQPVVHQPDQLSWIRNHGGPAAGCWIKVDTGMNRLGFPLDQIEMVYRTLVNCCHQKPGLISHFATADEPSHSLNFEQLTRFQSLVGQFETTFSMANSAALTNWENSQFDMVRPGLLLYGISPLVDSSAKTLGLQPVMRFESRIIAIKQLPPGSTVGYGATWRSDLPRVIAIVAAGYADGYPRVIGNRGHVMVRGKSAPVIGRVSMDTLALDISQCGSVAVGQPVELWGGILNVTKVAAWADTIAYELLCRVSERVPRIAVDRLD